MNRTTFALLASISVWAAIGCDRTTAASGTTDDTHSSIYVTGRVFDELSHPLGAVIVKLRHAGLSDTTNGDGVFAIKGERSSIAARALASVDTLDYLRDGVVVHSTSVPTWIDTLPDLFLVQRDIAGPIATGTLSPASTQGILWDAAGDSVHLHLEWNSQTGGYSGFTWFRYTGGVDSFRVQVRAMDSAGRITGTSSVIKFTSLAGNIAIPSFDAANALARIALRGPSVLNRGDTATFRSGAANTLGLPMSFLWKIGSGTWTPGRADTLFQAPLNLAGPSLVVHFRAVRSDSVPSEDSLRIPVAGTPPKAAIHCSVDTVAERRGFLLRFSDTTAPGSRITKRHLGPPWNTDVSGADTTVLAPDSACTLQVTYTVQTNLGDTAMAQASLVVTDGLPPGIRLSADSTDLHLTWNPGGTALFSVLAIDSTFGSFDETMNSAFFGDISFLDGVDPVATGNLRISRHSASKRVYVRILVSKFAETTLVAECPPMVWNFEAPIHRSDDFAYGTSADVPFGYIATGKGSGGIKYDTVFNSLADSIVYNLAPVVNNVSQGRITEFLATGWTEVKTLSLRVRGTPGSARIWIDPTFNGMALESDYQALQKQGITLGWTADIDSTSGLLTFSIDSLKWSDGIDRASPSRQAILANALGFSIGPASGTGSGFLVVDDIRFLR